MELTGEVYMNEYIGIDIGGTKTAIVRGDENCNDIFVSIKSLLLLYLAAAPSLLEIPSYLSPQKELCKSAFWSNLFNVYMGRKIPDNFKALRSGR